MASQRLNLAEVLLGGDERADRPALREPKRAWTYGDLARNVGQLGGALHGLGVTKGDRVAVLMPDGLEAVASILGVIRIGGIAVPVSELGRANDVRSYIRDSGAVVAIVHSSLEPIFDEVREELTSLREVINLGGVRGTQRSFEAMIAAAEPVPPADTMASDPALILYSAGASNNAPKGVIHSHETPLASYRAYAQAVLGIRADDRVFSAVKLPTAYGIGAGMVFPLAAGAESIMLPAQPKSAAVFELLRDHAPTVMFATPSLYGQLLGDLPAHREAHKADGAAASLSSLRACVSGAESLPVGLAQRLSALGVGEVLAGYGLTEAFHFVIATPHGKTRPGSSGVVVPGYGVRVVGEDGAPVAINEIGTLQINGPSAGLGYWNRPEETVATFRTAEGQRWIHTGDRFFVDGDGYFFHCGRVDDLFKVGGKWVSAAEVEQTLLAHEAVWECAVVGTEDEDGLTKPLAFVVPNVGHAPGPELEQALIDYVKREIAPYKYPRWIEFVDALPKGPHGKVLRYKLHAKPRRRAATSSPA